MNRLLFGFLLLVATMQLLPAPASASSAAASPVGFKVFCVRNPAQCRPTSDARVQLTAETMDTLKRVNLAVNKSIRPRNETSGRDVWALEPRSGDCEDYVVTKRARLILQGLPPGALRIAYAKTRRGEGHAVLIVRTSKGELVLDNLTNAVRPISQAGVRIISVSGADPRVWASR